jgi:hypothetical protein
MNKAIFGAIIASTFGLSALSAISADLTGDESVELRARAERLTADRAHNLHATSDVRLDQNPGDLKVKPHGDVKAKPAKSKVKKAKPSKMKHAEQSLKKVPGALVRH